MRLEMEMLLDIMIILGNFSEGMSKKGHSNNKRTSSGFGGTKRR